jgi:hypothetical protein
MSERPAISTSKMRARAFTVQSGLVLTQKNRLHTGSMINEAAQEIDDLRAQIKNLTSRDSEGVSLTMTKKTAAPAEPDEPNDDSNEPETDHGLIRGDISHEGIVFGEITSRDIAGHSISAESLGGGIRSGKIDLSAGVEVGEIIGGQVSFGEIRAGSLTSSWGLFSDPGVAAEKATTAALRATEWRSDPITEIRVDKSSSTITLTTDDQSNKIRLTIPENFTYMIVPKTPAEEVPKRKVNLSAGINDRNHILDAQRLQREELRQSALDAAAEAQKAARDAANRATATPPPARVREPQILAALLGLPDDALSRISETIQVILDQRKF